MAAFGSRKAACRVFQETDSDRRGRAVGEISISKQFQRSCEQAGISRLSSCDAYLDNLLRLKVLGEQQWAESKYHPAGVTDHGDYSASVENVTGRVIELTAFGEHFVETCVDKTDRDGAGV